MHPRYGWVGATRKAEVREAVAACTDAWLRDWCLQRETIVMEVGEVEGAEWLRREGAVLTLKCERGALLLALEEQQVKALGLRIVAIASDTPDVMARELANAALTDLMLRIGARAGLPSAGVEPANGPWPEALIRSEWGAMALKVTLGEIAMTIAMDRTVVSGMMPEQSPPSPLDGRTRSLQATQVPITAVLDFGQISVRDLAGLHIGEVLISERKLGQLAELRVGNSCVAGATIGSVGNHLAVVATAASDSKENS